MMKDENMTDKKVEDLKQSELAELTEKYLESDYAKPADENKEYSLVDNYVKELGLKGISLKDLGILGEADYTNMDKILGDAENKKLVEKYISEFIRADIITQQPHRTQGDDYVKISKDEDKEENYVDGGIFLWRVAEDEAFPDEDFDDAPLGTSQGEEDDDNDYVRMQYLDPPAFLMLTGLLAEEPYNLTTTEEIQEFIREKGLKELLLEQDEGRLSDEIEVSRDIAQQLIYCYTQDPDTDEIIMVKYTKEQTITSTFSEPLKEIGTTVKNAKNANAKYRIQLISMPYKDKIAKYIMPYEFLLNLCMITQNPEFVYHVALMARDTYIVLKVQDKETIIRDTTDTERVPKTDKATGFKKREIELTKEFSPTIQLRYANTWSWLEDFKYIKNYNIDTLEQNGPKRIADTEDYYEDQWTEQKEGYNDYGEPITQNSIHKSQQFLGLLRNEKGKCKCEEEEEEENKDCYKEEAWKDRNDPVALICVRKAEYDEEGINVPYYIPGMNVKEAPWNKLDGALQMFYAIMQSNYSGYKEWEKILSDIKETFKKAQEFFEKGDKNLFNDQYDEGRANYQNAYAVKMQGTLEHFRYLMEFPPNEGDLSIQNPKPGSVYNNGLNSNIVCYLIGSTGSSYGLSGVAPLAGEANNKILEACKIVTDTFLNRPGAHYSLGSDLISGDIDKCYNEATGICCATYVAMVLRVAGVIPPEQINSYNYHWTGDGGIPSLLEAAGWTLIDASQAEAGDIVNNFGVHVMVYAGDGKVWDQNTCVGDGSLFGAPYSTSIAGMQVWRAPASASTSTTTTTSNTNLTTTASILQDATLRR